MGGSAFIKKKEGCRAMVLGNFQCLVFYKGQGPYIYTVLAGCACEHYLDIFSCLFKVFYISCSLLLGDVSIWTVKMVRDSSLKDTSSVMTIFNSVHTLGGLVAQWVKRWPTDLAD